MNPFNIFSKKKDTDKDARKDEEIKNLQKELLRLSEKVFPARFNPGDIITFYKEKSWELQKDGYVLDIIERTKVDELIYRVGHKGAIYNIKEDKMFHVLSKNYTPKEKTELDIFIEEISEYFFPLYQVGAKIWFKNNGKTETGYISGYCNYHGFIPRYSLEDTCMPVKHTDITHYTEPSKTKCQGL